MVTKQLIHIHRRSFVTAATASSSAAAVAFLSPAVAWWIRTEGVDPKSIKGTGKGGRLLKYDVLKAIKEGTAKKVSRCHASTTSHAASCAPAYSSSVSFPMQQPSSSPRELSWYDHIHFIGGLTSTGRRLRSPLLSTILNKSQGSELEVNDAQSIEKVLNSKYQYVMPSRNRARTHSDIPL